MSRIKASVFDYARAVIADAIREGGVDVVKFPALAAEVIVARLESAGIALTRDDESEVA